MCIQHYNPCIHGSVMAKLYWRIKKNGKWTWKPVRGNWMTSKEIASDLIFYSKAFDPEEE